MESKQIQKAGDNSQQTVVNNYNYGMNEEQAIALYKEQQVLTMSACSELAKTIANDRIEQFANVLLPRIQKIENDYQSFSDPSFQVLLRKAQMTAACTEREDDYKILSELLVHRIKNKSNIKKKASISKAVEIIDQIDDDSLRALTVFLAIKHFTPVSGNISDGLAVLDNLYSKLDLDSLPTDTSWIDNLSILGAVNTVSFGRMKKYEQYFSENLSGYVCAGIKADSEDYLKAVSLLKGNNISANFLVENELLPGYARLEITAEQEIDTLSFTQRVSVNGLESNISVPLSNKQKNCLKEIIDMYVKDASLISQAKSGFSDKLDTYLSIAKAKAWWNSLKGSIQLTSVGRVIAHTNAKSIDNTLPNLD